MTKQESFKRRIRARMEKTGERYAAARRVLIEQSAATRRSRTWAAEPEVNDDAVRRATGRGWEEWCDLIDDWPDHANGHQSIASHLADDLGVDAWWAQTVTVGYERITGLRLPYQRPDGTFSASKSKTVGVKASVLRDMLLVDETRRAMFPGHSTHLLSKPGSKAVRFTMDVGVVLVALEAKPDGRTKVTISHEKLPAYANVEEWKFYWAEWLEAVATA